MTVVLSFYWIATLEQDRAFVQGSMHLPKAHRKSLLVSRWRVDTDYILKHTTQKGEFHRESLHVAPNRQQ